MRRPVAAFLSAALTCAGLVAATPATAVPADRAPVAQGDRLTTREDTRITWSAPGVLANDTAPGGGRLTARMVRRPRHGTARLAADGRLVYTPDANWSGTDRVVYVARTATGRTDRATVRLTVRPVDDAPVLSMSLQTPVREFSTSRVTLSARDPEGTALTYRFDCDGIGGFEVVQDSRRHDCAFGDEGAVTVRGRVVDATGTAATASIPVTVTNQEPIVSLPDTAAGGPAGQGITVDLGSFADPGAEDGDWVASVDWGDGSVEEVGVFALPGDLGDLSHTWSQPGLYEVVVRVTEAGGAVGRATAFINVTG